ncbi:MAG: hypothetical protein QGH40_16930 [bacterium]|jgi:polyhydroxyalkanoate synthesis regulator phasin|nr:hypothetical protein [bacterium]
MESMLQKMLYAGIGLFTMNKEQTEEIVKNLIERGEMTASEGEKTLKTLLERIQDEKDKLVDRVGIEVKDKLTKAGFVRREEYEKLLKKLEALEAQITGQAEKDTEEE